MHEVAQIDRDTLAVDTLGLAAGRGQARLTNSAAGALTPGTRFRSAAARRPLATAAAEGSLRDQDHLARRVRQGCYAPPTVVACRHP
jgi:hypothetical protein